MLSRGSAGVGSQSPNGPRRVPTCQGAATPPQQGAHPGLGSFSRREQGFLEKQLVLKLGKRKHERLEDAVPGPGGGSGSRGGGHVEGAQEQLDQLNF